MQVIFEGPDGSGKTTLLLKLAQVTKWPIVPGEGPEKYPGEMMARIQRYLEEARYAEDHSCFPRIFDRHPCIGHQVYSRFTRVSQVSELATDQLYNLKNVIVYCKAPDDSKLIHEQNKDHDTGEHLEAITSKHSEICDLYDRWALKRAHIIYRYWEPGATQRTIQSIIAATGEKA